MRATLSGGARPAACRLMATLALSFCVQFAHAQDPAPYGLDTRPSNLTCLAVDRRRRPRAAVRGADDQQSDRIDADAGRFESLVLCDA